MTQTFTLSTPVNAPEGPITEITLDEPSVFEITRLQDDAKKHGDMRAMVQLIATQSKCPPAVINQVKARDFMAMQEYLAGFFSDTPPQT